MRNGEIRDLSNIYGKKPYGLDLDKAREIVKSINNVESTVEEPKVKKRSRKNVEAANRHRKIKRYSAIGLLTALGISGSVLFGSKLASTYIQNTKLTELAKQVDSPQYDLTDEKKMTEFSILLQQTEYLLNNKELSDSDKEILRNNLITISNNLGNVIDYTDSKIADLFSNATGKSVEVKTLSGYDAADGPFNKIFIEIGQFVNNKLYGETTYSFNSHDWIRLKDEKNINSARLKDLIDNQFKLSAINNDQKSYAPLDKTFKLVKENIEKVSSLEDLSILIDEKGNIVENNIAPER